MSDKLSETVRTVRTADHQPVFGPPHGVCGPARFALLSRACGGITLAKAPDVMPSRESVFERVRRAGLDRKASAALLWLDDMVGAILKKLEQLNLRENTMVVFMQDNGHRWEGKNTVYEGGIHVSPTYISWPAGLKIPGDGVPNSCRALIWFPPSWKQPGHKHLTISFWTARA